MKFFRVLELLSWLALGLAAGAFFAPGTEDVNSAPKVSHSPARVTPETSAESFSAKSRQLAAILKEPNACHEFKSLLAFVDSLTPDEFPRALAQLRAAPETNRDETLDALIGRWMEIDPEGAIGSTVQARAMEDHDFGDRVITDIYNAWSRKDPDDALDDARHSLSGEEQKTALQAVLGQVAREDPGKALGVIAALPSDSSAPLVTTVFTGWAATDPASATRAALQFTDENRRLAALSGIAAGLVDRDPRAATAWANQLPPGTAHDAGLKEVAEAWSEIDPAAAMTWLNGLAAFKDKDSVRDSMALDWAVRDAVGTVKHGLTLPVGKERDSMLEWGLAQWTYDDAYAAGAWVKSLPASPTKKNSIATLMAYWCDYDPAAAAAYLAAIPESEGRRDGVGLARSGPGCRVGGRARGRPRSRRRGGQAWRPAGRYRSRRRRKTGRVDRRPQGAPGRGHRRPAKVDAPGPAQGHRRGAEFRSAASGKKAAPAGATVWLSRPDLSFALKPLGEPKERAKSRSLKNKRDASEKGAPSIRQDDPRTGEVVGIELKVDFVAKPEADEVQAQFARGAGNAAVAVAELDAVGAVLQNFDDHAPGIDQVGAGHGRNLERRA
jgi:hypothetical protein